jgi:hypothetical protein
LTFTNLNNDKEIACLNKHPIVKFIHCPLVFNAPKLRSKPAQA